MPAQDRPSTPLTSNLKTTNLKTSHLWAYHLGTFFIAVGMALTLISALGLCSSACTEAHDYRLFGLPFEAIGGAYFVVLALFHFLAYGRPSFRFYTGLLIAAGLGAEGYLIALQKMRIGTYCPVCLSIAATILLLGLCYIAWQKKENQEDLMGNFFRVGALALFLTAGFTTSFFGISKIDKLQAVEDAIKEKIKFGSQNSPIEVYVFTDWACPACRAIEPALEKMAPQIMQRAQLTFVDTVVHPETLNFAPYNISFMVNAKPKYFQIRGALGQLSTKTKKPTDQEISNAVKLLGVRYQELPYGEVSVAMHYFEDLVERFKITGTPTVAIVNRQAKKGKKLSGIGEITEANLIKAIDSLR